MKQLLCLLLTLAAALMMAGCAPAGERPFADIDAADVAEVEISLQPPGTTFTVAAGEDIDALCALLREIVLYEQDDAGRETVGQLVSFSLTLTDGGAINVGAYGDYVYVDDVCYRAKYEPSQALNAFGNSYYHELPDRGTPPQEEAQSVEYNHLQVNISLNIPVGWEYEIEEYAEDGFHCGISFWPQGCAGKAGLYYYDSFGVCGTGLETQDVTFADGKSGWMGIYDGNAYWNFISFNNSDDTKSCYVAMTEGVEDWWDDYGEQVMDILDTAKLGADAAGFADGE